MAAFVIQVFLNLFIVIDPIGLAPIFISLAGDRPVEEQFRIARQAIVVSTIILSVFALLGNLLLDFLGINMEAFQVATGILLFKIAFDMVFVQNERETEQEQEEARVKQDISVFPLAIPLIAGPGTLASLLILHDESKIYDFGWLIVIAIAIVVLTIAYILLCLSRYLSALLGQTGINVVTRVLGVILTALAMQYISDGVIVMLRAVLNP